MVSLAAESEPVLHYSASSEGHRKLRKKKKLRILTKRIMYEEGEGEGYDWGNVQILQIKSQESLSRRA